MRRRAISVQINYTLSLVIVTLLLSATLLSINDVLQTERSQIVQSEVEVIGNRVASDLGAADRLAVRAGDNPGQEVSLTTSLPADLAGADYEIVVDSSGMASGSYYLVEITVRAATLGVSDTVSLKTETPVEDTSIQGGTYSVRLVDRSGTETLVLERADS